MHQFDANSHILEEWHRKSQIILYHWTFEEQPEKGCVTEAFSFLKIMDVERIFRDRIKKKALEMMEQNFKL